MKSAKMSSIIALGMLALVQSTASQAHFIWLEQDKGQARLYFGEYENKLREKTGGKLDNIATLQAWVNPKDAKTAGKKDGLSLKRKDDHIAIPVSDGAGVIAQELGMRVKDLSKHHLGIVKPMYYARLAQNSAESATALDLDIQPLGNNKVRVNLHGKLLSKAKLNIFAPNQWTREYETDAAGEAVVEMPWSGLYVLQVAHIEPVKGEYQGDVYEAVRHVSTLSLSHQ